MSHYSRKKNSWKKLFQRVFQTLSRKRSIWHGIADDLLSTLHVWGSKTHDRHVKERWTCYSHVFKTSLPITSCHVSPVPLMDVHFKHSQVNNEPTVCTVIPESPKFRLQTDRLSVYQIFHAIASLRGHRANSQTEDVDAFLLFIYFFKPNEAKICFLQIAENSPAHLH